MILARIKELLHENEALSAGQIATKTGYDRQVIQQALDTWLEKGKVERLVIENPCSGCLSSCASRSCSEDAVLYRWKSR
ncbi:MAG: FeoC-like transcriptional regulator [Spirochaetota bacterium]